MRFALLIPFAFAVGTIMYVSLAMPRQPGKGRELWESDVNIRSVSGARDFALDRIRKFSRDLQQGFNQLKNTDIRPAVRRVTRFIGNRLEHFAKDVLEGVGNLRAFESEVVSDE